MQDAVRASGRRLHSKHFLVLVSPSATGRCRLGLTVTTKVDKRAVKRNKIKRFVREVFRKNSQRFSEPVALVVIARMESPLLSFKEVEQELLKAFHYGKLLPR